MKNHTLWISRGRRGEPRASAAAKWCWVARHSRFTVQQPTRPWKQGAQTPTLAGLISHLCSRSHASARIFDPIRKFDCLLREYLRWCQLSSQPRKYAAVICSTSFDDDLAELVNPSDQPLLSKTEAALSRPAVQGAGESSNPSDPDQRRRNSKGDGHNAANRNAQLAAT